MVLKDGLSQCFNLNALWEINNLKIAWYFIVNMFYDLEDFTGHAECNAPEGQLGIG